MKNSNRDLDADQVRHLVAKNLPHHVPGLAQDRAWLWLVTNGKPPEADRKLLVELGFSFTPRMHELPDGRTAYWFHAAGGFVRRGGRTSGRRAARPQSDPIAALMALAAEIAA